MKQGCSGDYQMTERLIGETGAIDRRICTDASNAELYVTVAQSGSPSHLTTERSIIVTKAPETSPDIGP